MSDSVLAFARQVPSGDTSLVLFFCSPQFDLDELSAAMRSRFPASLLVGCTTAGEIGPLGYSQASLTGAAFSAADFGVVCRRFEGLDAFSFDRARSIAQDALQELEVRAPGADASNTFALLLIDGLSVREERVTGALQGALGKIPLVGGSAADGLVFRRTGVFCGDRFCSDCAVLVLITTRLPFRPFMTQHFTAVGPRLVVTSAQAAQRVVHEFDGLPAAQVYADQIGLTVEQLCPPRFAASPLAVTIGGTNYVRAISKALPDGSLRFFCAIEEGVVMRVTRGDDLVGNLDRSFAQLRASIGPPQIIIGFDCILRRLEIQRSGQTQRVADLLKDNQVCGFNTYGEQYCGVHVNQTFTGVAVGYPSEGKHD